MASIATEEDVYLIITIHKLNDGGYNDIRFRNGLPRNSYSDEEVNFHFAPHDTNRHWNAWSPNMTISYSGHGADAEYNITVTRVQLPPGQRKD